MSSKPKLLHAAMPRMLFSILRALAGVTPEWQPAHRCFHVWSAFCGADASEDAMHCPPKMRKAATRQCQILSPAWKRKCLLLSRFWNAKPFSSFLSIDALRRDVDEFIDLRERRASSARLETREAAAEGDWACCWLFSPDIDSPSFSPRLTRWSKRVVSSRPMAQKWNAYCKLQCVMHASQEAWKC